MDNADILRTRIEFKTYDPRDPTHTELNELVRVHSDQEFRAHGRRSSNYGPSFKLEDQLAITVGQLAGELVSFSTVFQRPFYPGNVARVMNRRYKNPSFRFRTMYGRTINPAEFIAEAVSQQIDFLRTRPEIEFVFLSREVHCPRLMALYAEGLTRHTRYHWTVPDDLFLVCPHPTGWSCWQHVIYADIRGTGKQFALAERASFIELKQRLGPWRT